MRSFLLAFVAFLALGCHAAGDGGPIASPTDAEGTHVKQWKEIDTLVENQQFEAAARLVEELREEASRDGNEELAVRALIRHVQLRTALHGFEKSVALLAPYVDGTERPESVLQRSLIDLFYAHSLVIYTDAYSWEIRQRERVDTGEALEIGSWTIDQIVVEAHRAFGRVWEQREAWGDKTIEPFEEFIAPGNHPSRIRGTLRDSMTYLWVDLLANSSLWRPEHSSQIYKLDLPGLIEGAGDLDLSDPAVHPLRRIAFVLADLERWHLAGGRAEAASEARLERLRKLRDSFTRADDRLEIRTALERHQEELGRDLPWWSTGQALLAELVRDEGSPDSLARARALAIEGAEAHPGSVGGGRCQHLVAAIEAAAYSLESMISDAPGKRSLRVLHKNLDRLYFRAYPVDLKRRLLRSRDRDLLVDRQEVDSLVATGRPELEWTVDLPATPDYRNHATFVTPPIERPGLFVVVSSVREDFEEQRNSRSAVPVLFTDLVLIRREAPTSVEVTVRSGVSGEPIWKADVSLWRRDYRRGHQQVAQGISGHDGVTQLRLNDKRGTYFLIAEHDGQLAVDESYLSRREPPVPGGGRDSLLYTDRSIYRPGQELHWKLVAYDGVPEKGNLETLPATEVTVELRDAAGQVVESFGGETNAFGSVSGSFTIPPGRRLGQWYLFSSLRGRLSPVRVEEYKRPTFEVSISDPEDDLRLNRPALLGGEARYYFGLPVVEGRGRLARRARAGLSALVVRPNLWPG